MDLPWPVRLSRSAEVFTCTEEKEPGSAIGREPQEDGTVAGVDRFSKELAWRIINLR